jgi:hypothetical protein
MFDAKKVKDGSIKEADGWAEKEVSLVGKAENHVNFIQT